MSPVECWQFCFVPMLFIANPIWNHALTFTHWDGAKVPAQGCRRVAPNSGIGRRIPTVIWYFVQRGVGKFWRVIVEVGMWRLRIPALTWQPWCCHIRIASVWSTRECVPTPYIGRRYCGKVSKHDDRTWNKGSVKCEKTDATHLCSLNLRVTPWRTTKVPWSKQFSDKYGRYHGRWSLAPSMANYQWSWYWLCRIGMSFWSTT